MEPWRFAKYLSGECSIRTFFDFETEFGQGHLGVLASNERAVWGRNSPQFDFVEITVHLMHRFAVPSDARSPLSLKFGDVEFLADWTTGRTFDQSIPDGSTVQARLSDSYLLLGGDAEEFLRWAAVSNDLIVRFDGQGVEPDAEIHVRTANAENAVPEMLECMRALRAP